MFDRLRELLISHTKAHHAVLMMTSICFVRVCWHNPEATVVAAAGGTLATLYGANAWAGSYANGKGDAHPTEKP